MAWRSCAGELDRVDSTRRREPAIIPSDALAVTTRATRDPWSSAHAGLLLVAVACVFVSPLDRETFAASVSSISSPAAGSHAHDCACGRACKGASCCCGREPARASATPNARSGQDLGKPIAVCFSAAPCQEPAAPPASPVGRATKPVSLLQLLSHLRPAPDRGEPLASPRSDRPPSPVLARPEEPPEAAA
jgi:hypothetical protein